jgi:hypothetical protein
VFREARRRAPKFFLAGRGRKVVMAGFWVRDLAWSATCRHVLVTDCHEMVFFYQLVLLLHVHKISIPCLNQSSIHQIVLSSIIPNMPPPLIDPSLRRSPGQPCQSTMSFASTTDFPTIVLFRGSMPLCFTLVVCLHASWDHPLACSYSRIIVVLS